MIGFILIVLGSIISVIGAVGLVRFPDVYTRSHAQTVLNVGGVCLTLLGVFLESFLSLYSIKCLLLILFIFLTSPVDSHAIARAAYKSGVKPKRLQEDQLSYKIIQDEKPFKPPEPEQKPKKPKYKRKPSPIKRAKERIKKHMPFRKEEF